MRRLFIDSREVDQMRPGWVAYVSHSIREMEGADTPSMAPTVAGVTAADAAGSAVAGSLFAQGSL